MDGQVVLSTAPTEQSHAGPGAALCPHGDAELCKHCTHTCTHTCTHAHADFIEPFCATILYVDFFFLIWKTSEHFFFTDSKVSVAEIH